MNFIFQSCIEHTTNSDKGSIIVTWDPNGYVGPVLFVLVNCYLVNLNTIQKFFFKYNFIKSK